MAIHLSHLENASSHLRRAIKRIEQYVQSADESASTLANPNAAMSRQPGSSLVGEKPALRLIGTETTASLFAVSDFAQAAVAVAVSQVQALRQLHWGIESQATVDRLLASSWCQHSVYPIGWPAPAGWDEFAGDYACLDGWIRLHTNARHHRLAALNVLGNPADKLATATAVSSWQGAELESAVVDAGGAAAFMMSRQLWKNHPQGRAIAAEPLVSWQQKSQINPDLQPLQLRSASRPLQGLRVLDLTRVLAGPVCTRFLAAFGADVLRIDPHHWEEDGNALEMTIGKRCAGLDLKQQADRTLFDSLLADCDVLVRGYRREALANLGYSDAAIKAINPRCIDVALNAYGWTGPWANRRGFDSLVQMSSGIADYGLSNGFSDRPQPLPFQALDHISGYLMAASVVHAINQRVGAGRIYTAKLSLASTANLLWEICGPESVDQHFPASSNITASNNRETLDNTTVGRHIASDSDQFMNPGVEQTPWGPVKRLRLPFSIDGVDTGFDRPANRLRTSVAQW